MKCIDLTGLKFGRLLVVSRSENAGAYVAWNCSCDCGNSCIVRGISLRRGQTKSCGCLKSDATAERNKLAVKHGETKTRLYRIWSGLKDRCLNKASRDFQNYGGRGVSICEAWTKDFIAFRSWAMQSGYTAGLTIERIDVNGGYCPQNCTWIPAKKQAANRRCNVFYNGVCLAEWSRRTGNSYYAIAKRVSAGWDLERAIFTPVRPKKH